MDGSYLAAFVEQLLFMFLEVVKVEEVLSGVRKFTVEGRHKNVVVRASRGWGWRRRVFMVDFHCVERGLGPRDDFLS